MDTSGRFESAEEAGESVSRDACGPDGKFDCSAAWRPCRLRPYATAECFL